MTRKTRSLIIGAALSGFLAGTTANAVAQSAGGDQSQPDKDKAADKNKVEKHACKGQNSCKGKGGCGTTKGKNECKGKGECRTDGKPMGS
jgi:hypothetical protein